MNKANRTWSSWCAERSCWWASLEPWTCFGIITVTTCHPPSLAGDSQKLMQRCGLHWELRVNLEARSQTQNITGCPRMCRAHIEPIRRVKTLVGEHVTCSGARITHTNLEPHDIIKLPCTRTSVLLALACKGGFTRVASRVPPRSLSNSPSSKARHLQRMYKEIISVTKSRHSLEGHL